MQNEFYSFRDKAEASDQPQQVGHHGDPGRGFDKLGNPIASVTPDICAIVDERNGWLTEQEIAEAPRNRRYADAAELLSGVLRYLASSADIHSMGIRGWALVLSVRPDLAPEQTQMRLARKFGLTRQAISKYVREIFALGNGIFRHGDNIRGSNYRAGARRQAVAYHERVGHRNRRGDP